MAISSLGTAARLALVAVALSNSGTAFAAPAKHNDSGKGNAASSNAGGSNSSNSGGGNAGGNSGSNSGGGNAGGNSGSNSGGGNSGGSASTNNGGGNASVSPRACALSDVSITAQACSGFFAGNLLNGSSEGIAAQTSALAQIGLAWDGNFNAVDKISSLNGSTLVDIKSSFNKSLAGLTYVGVHFGNGAGLGGQATGFWRFDAGSALVDSFSLNILQGSSGFVLYKTGVPGGGDEDGGGNETGPIPEPGSWALLIAGFAITGAVMRRRRIISVAC